MNVKMARFHLRVRTFERRLMQPHAVRKLRFEEVIIPSRDLCYRFREQFLFLFAEIW